MDPRFAHIRDWIFDLDNCLYPASTGLFELIDERMGAYIERLLGCDPAEARRVQKAHFHESWHDACRPDEASRRRSAPFPGRRPRHPARPGRARRAAGRRAAAPARAASSSSPTAMRLMPGGCSSDRRRTASSTICTTSHASRPDGPSPTRTAIAMLCERFGIDPAQALLVDDMVQNLAPAKALGMTTVWVDNGSERGNHGYDEAIVDHRVDRCRRMARKHLGGRAMSD